MRNIVNRTDSIKNISDLERAPQESISNEKNSTETKEFEDILKEIPNNNPILINNQNE